MSKLRLFHTSPEEIKKIHSQGRFGPGLFFADSPYVTTAASNPKVYGHEVDEDEIINASDFEYLEPEDYKKIKHLVKNIMNYTDLDEEDSLALLSGSNDIHSMFRELQDYLYYNEEDDEDEDEYEEYQQKKRMKENLESIDMAEFDWDLQRDALLAANILNKRGVGLRDEQGPSWLINMMDRENQLKHIKDKESRMRFEAFEDEEENPERSPHNLKFKY